MDIDDSTGLRDSDPLGDVPFPPESATDVLSRPRWAYLQFEFSIIDNEIGEQDDVNPFLHPGLTADDLADRLEISEENLKEDIQALVECEVIRVESESEPPSYTPCGYQLWPQNPIELPDGDTIDYLPPQSIGAVGYGHLDDAVQQYLDQHGYKSLDEAVKIYHKALLNDEPDRTLEEWFPSIPDKDIASIQPALDYAYDRLSEDPLWGYEYAVDD